MAVFTILCSCSEDLSHNVVTDFEDQYGEPTKYVNIPVEYSAHAVIPGQSKFSIDLFKNICAEDNKNISVSSYSVFSILSMLANGYDIEKSKEILAVLGYKESELNALNSYCKTMNEFLPIVDSQTKCNFANSIWTEKGVSLNGDMLSTMTDVFNCELFALEKDALPSNLDKWIAENTNNRIKDFTKDKLITFPAIVNTTYFRGRWAEQFKSENTSQRKFTDIRGKKVSVDYMNGTINGQYAEYEGWEKVTIYYGNKNFAISLISPPSNKQPSDISNDIYNGLSGKAYKLNLHLPKFEVKWQKTINEILKNMGIVSIFDGARFNLFVDDDYSLDQIIHECNITVNEGGTEAAAVTAATFVTSTGEEPGYAEVSFDRPFLYTIEETSTETVLFIGQVVSF